MMATTQGLSPEFKSRVEQWLAAGGGKFSLLSAYRDPAHQRRLWNEALAKYKNPEIADNYVARPGSSNHERGEAVDIQPRSQYEYAAQLAKRFGLYRPMSWEPWHFERSDLRHNPGAYTAPQPKGPKPVDPLTYIKDSLIPVLHNQLLARFDQVQSGINFIKDHQSSDHVNIILGRIDDLDKKLSSRMKDSSE